MNGNMSAVKNKALNWKLYLVFALIIVADLLLFVSIKLNDSVIYVFALGSLLIALIFSTALAAYSLKIEIIQTGKFLSILAAFTFVSVSLPSSGDAYIDILVLSIVFFLALLLSNVSFVDCLPYKRYWIAVAIVIGIGFGIVSFSVLHGTIARIVRTDLLLPLLPIAIFFGYMEEVFFRSGLQKNMEPTSSRTQSIVIPALLDTGLSALWGLIEFCLVVFIFAIILGWLYSKFHCVVLNGISRSLECGLIIGLAMIL
ncbi:MAG: type II CAAX prenyl endopeptidase Rce1 family protein [Methanomassiliicoccales archaeon]